MTELRALGFAFVAMVVAVCLLGAANSVVTVQSPKLMLIALPTTGRTPQALDPTPGAGGTKCTSIVASNTSGTGFDVAISILRGGTNYVLCTVTVPANSGFAAATAGTSILTSTNCPGIPRDANGNPYFFLNAGDQLQANTVAATSTAGAVSVLATCGDF